jgi:hypothetical protein
MMGLARFIVSVVIIVEIYVILCGNYKDVVEKIFLKLSTRRWNLKREIPIVLFKIFRNMVKALSCKRKKRGFMNAYFDATDL